MMDRGPSASGFVSEERADVDRRSDRELSLASTQARLEGVSLCTDGQRAIEQGDRGLGALRAQWQQLCRWELRVRTLRAPLPTARANGIRDTLSEALDEGIAVTGADMGNVQLFDPVTGTLKIEAQRGFGDPFLDFFRCVGEGEHLCGIAFEGARQIVVDDVTESPLFPRGPALEAMLDARVRAVQSTPLVAPSGLVLGVLSTHFRRPRRHPESELRAVAAVVQRAACALERRYGLSTPYGR
jgi:hypothetical protein